MARNSEPVDIVSAILSLHGTPTVGQFEQVADENVNREAFWFSLALSKGVKQRSSGSITRHMYDVARRPVARGKYKVTLLENGIGSTHDIPELDFLGKKNGEIGRIRPVVASYSILDILGNVLGEDIAYGIEFGGVGSLNERFGGVNYLTNHLRTVAEMASNSPETSNEGLYAIRNENGREVAYLTDNGRDVFVRSLDKVFEPGFEAQVAEVGMIRAIVRNRLSGFVDGLAMASTFRGGKKNKKDDLTAQEQKEISDLVEPLIESIRHSPKPDVFVGGVSIDKLVQDNYEVVRAAVANPENVRPVDINLITSGESQYEVILKKTVYSAFVRKIGEGVRAAAKAFGQSSDQSYLHPLMVKIMDATDNVSTMGPNLDNITSIYRKARIVFNEGLETLKFLNTLGVPKKGRERLYLALSFLLERLDDSIKYHKMYYVGLARNESRYEESREVMTYMDQLNEKSGYVRLLARNNPAGSGVFGMLSSSLGRAAGLYSY